MSEYMEAVTTGASPPVVREDNDAQNDRYRDDRG
jgi:hypothetical protein